jgi:hypothetical protein
MPNTTSTSVSRCTRASRLYKTYTFGSLDHIDLQRIHLIRSAGHLLFPPVDIQIGDTQVIVSQALIEEVTLFTIGYTTDHLNVLAKIVQAWHDAGLVHGDLCLSNVGWHKQDIFVFDWEPLLVWRSPKGVLLRTTPYCLHPIDRTNKTVSVLTDRYALITLLLMRERIRLGPCFEMRKHLRTAAVLSEDMTIPCPLLLQGIITNLEDRIPEGTGVERGAVKV